MIFGANISDFTSIQVAKGTQRSHIHIMNASSLLAVETGPFERVAAEGKPWNLLAFF
jgi:hypothetical protein